MPFTTTTPTTTRTPLLLLLLLVDSSNRLLTTTVTAAAAAADDDNTNTHHTNNNKGRPQFPAQFVVSTGHTIPIAKSGPYDGSHGGIDPIAQSGQIFFDLYNKKVRIDNDWMGHRRSFIADLESRRGYVINDGACTMSVLTGELVPFSVPTAATRDGDPAAVRSVLVEGWSNVERVAANTASTFSSTSSSSSSSSEPDDDSDSDSKKFKSGGGSSGHRTSHNNNHHDDNQQQKDYMETTFYVRNMTWIQLGDPKTTTEDISLLYTIPWRIQTQRTTRHEIAMAPHHHWRNHERPNWRFFGEEEVDGWGDEVTKRDSRSSRTGVTRMLHDVQITTDFFNFVPMVPDPSVFEPPAQCMMQSSSSSSSSSKFEQAVKMEEIMCSLIEVSFNNQRGLRLMNDLYTYTHTRRLPSSTASSSASTSSASDRSNSGSGSSSDDVKGSSTTTQQQKNTTVKERGVDDGSSSSSSAAAETVTKSEL